FELADARKIAQQCRIPLTVIEGDILADQTVVANPENRCYYCKRVVFGMILRQATTDGYKLVVDGTNASDDASDRPGMRALQEMEVLSPLRECGLTKSDVRAMSREADLFTWNKPSYACLATRIPSGTAITAEALKTVEAGENVLFSMGFQDFRIRLRGDVALLQIPASQFSYAVEKRQQLLERLSTLFSTVSLDLRTR
ncbi:ATP-dependent sacrificial sulfur transferase LarE, partial [Oscillibacter sp.]|uniref:ATP-dependent sacrificial sulfur transferase LarE n=1 Tax=Oscillibacter sp. TaxID=1945593 RepID=UPI002896E8EC